MASLGSAHGTALVLNFDGEGVEVAAVNEFCVVSSAVEYFQISDLQDKFEDCLNIGRFQLKNLIDSYDPANDLSKDVKFLSDLNENYTTCITTNTTCITNTNPNNTNTTNTSIPLNKFHSSFHKIFISDLNEKGLNLINVIESILERIEPDRKSITLNHLICTGSFPLPFQLLCSSLNFSLISSSILAVSDYPAESQPTLISFRSIPEYYNEIKEIGRDSIAWFGASLTGKYAHSDSKTFIIPSKNNI